VKSRIELFYFLMFYNTSAEGLYRTAGPTACLKMLNKVYVFEKLEKIQDCMDLDSLEPAAIQFTLEVYTMQAVTFIYLYPGTLESDLLP